jgi:hypothetical protein
VQCISWLPVCVQFDVMLCKTPGVVHCEACLVSGRLLMPQPCFPTAAAGLGDSTQRPLPAAVAAESGGSAARAVQGLLPGAHRPFSITTSTTSTSTPPAAAATAS